MSHDSEPSTFRRLLTWQRQLTIATRTRVYKVSMRCEHLGFVAIAAVDAFHWHSYLFVVSIWLFITGLAIELFGGVE